MQVNVNICFLTFVLEFEVSNTMLGFLFDWLGFFP